MDENEVKEKFIEEIKSKKTYDEAYEIAMEYLEKYGYYLINLINKDDYK